MFVGLSIVSIVSKMIYDTANGFADLCHFPITKVDRPLLDLVPVFTKDFFQVAR